MRRKNAKPMESRCSCGSDLRWETRQRSSGQASLALCSNPDCGIVTTPKAADTEPNDGLRTFLIGGAPAARYLKPWLRLYFRTLDFGFRWRPYHERCSACSHELTTELRLPPRSDRYSDPHQVVLCMNCGATKTAFWLNGERAVLSLDGNAWDEPATVLQALKRALEERAYEPRHEGPFFG
jgi:hypothetical protein